MLYMKIDPVLMPVVVICLTDVKALTVRDTNPEHPAVDVVPLTRRDNVPHMEKHVICVEV